MPDFLKITHWQPVTCLVTGRTWDADTFAGEISRRTGALSRLRVAAGDMVFLLHNNSLECLADLFALWGLGARAALLSPGLTDPEVRNLIAFAGSKLLLTAPGERGGDKQYDAPAVDLARVSLEEGPRVSFAKPFELILFTSGTTGNPKGVVHTRGTIEKKIQINISHFGTAVFERSLCLLSTHFVAGLFSNILTPLAAGGKVFLYPDPGVRGAARIGPLVGDEGITFINSVPSLWNVILKASKPPAKSRLKLVSVVSAPLTDRRKKAIKAWSGARRVLSLYGTTETGGWNTKGETEGMDKGSVGHILGGEAALLAENGAIVKTGKGELLIKSPAVMSQYLNRPDLNRKAFIEGWFKTGDFAEIDEAGDIFIKGRAKGQINRAGIKIIPEEIEALLEQHPDVRAACVFGYPDPVMGEGVAVTIELNPGVEENFPAIRNWCKSRTRALTIPEKWFRVKTMPRNERGKADRTKIRNSFFREGKF